MLPRLPEQQFHLQDLDDGYQIENPFGRHYFRMLGVSGSLYALGGRYRGGRPPDRYFSSSFERYDPQLDSWENLLNLPLPRAEDAADLCTAVVVGAVQAVGSSIFVSKSRRSLIEGELETSWYYDTAGAQDWTEVTWTPTSWAASPIVLRDAVYLLAEEGQDMRPPEQLMEANASDDEKGVQRFRIYGGGGCWETMPSMEIAQNGFSIVSIQELGFIFTVGGSLAPDDSDSSMSEDDDDEDRGRNSSQVQRFNLNAAEGRGMWTTCAYLPTPRAFSQVVALAYLDLQEDM